MRRAASLMFAMALCAAGPAFAAQSASEFLAANAKAPGVTALPSGLQYKVTKSGDASGIHPKEGDAIKVNYEGALASGEVFDSSFQRGKPALMILEQLVPGWMEALPLMRAGDEWTLYLPPELGYGNRGAGPIPPGSALVFRLQLLGVLSAD
ncbi:MAG: FKBP-type peptidyl-prolyl cis-trans isomerase [Caulobacteraceae bacterium]